MWTVLTVTMWVSPHWGGPRKLISSHLLTPEHDIIWTKLILIRSFFDLILTQYFFCSLFSLAYKLVPWYLKVQRTWSNEKKHLIRISSNSIDTHVQYFWLGQQITGQIFCGPTSLLSFGLLTLNLHPIVPQYSGSKQGANYVCLPYTNLFGHTQN